jgi:CopG family nickel-responsive transcriptional regulator
MVYFSHQISIFEEKSLSDLIRFGVSIDQDLLENYDRLIAERGYATRSEALRDLIRDTLIQQKIEIQPDIEVLGSLTLVYDHHARNLSQEMGSLQHDFHNIILSVMHLHVSHDDCMEILALRGNASEIVKLANGLLSLKGIKNGKLFLTMASSSITSSN